MNQAPLDLGGLAEEETNAALEALDKALNTPSGPPSLIPNRPSQVIMSAEEVAVAPAKPERRLARRAKQAGVLASLLGLLTAVTVALGPRLADMIQSPPEPAAATAARDTTTYATQVALDAALVRLAQLERCPPMPAPDTTCARIQALEDCQKLTAEAAAALNGGSMGPNWEFSPGRFEAQKLPPPLFKTDKVYPCAGRN